MLKQTFQELYSYLTFIYFYTMYSMIALKFYLYGMGFKIDALGSA